MYETYFVSVICTCRIWECDNIMLLDFVAPSYHVNTEHALVISHLIMCVVVILWHYKQFVLGSK